LIFDSDTFPDASMAERKHLWNAAVENHGPEGFAHPVLFLGREAHRELGNRDAIAFPISLLIEGQILPFRPALDSPHSGVRNTIPAGAPILETLRVPWYQLETAAIDESSLAKP
jgi:hypothetical protein